MRTLEALLLLANLATFIALAFPRLRAAFITRFLPFTALLVTGANALGWRTLADGAGRPAVSVHCISHS